MTVVHATASDGPASPRRRFILNAIALMCIAGAIAMLGKSSWITLKAEVAQVLLDRAFQRALISGEAEKAWGWSDTWPVAEIRVPRLAARSIVLNGASGEALAFGPALLNETARPGDRGTSVIAAHRDTHFRYLQNVVVGDEVAVTRNDGLTFHFVVTSTRIAQWNHSGIDRHASGFNLVLSTCYPFDAVTSGTQRYIVEAALAP